MLKAAQKPFASRLAHPAEEAGKEDMEVIRYGVLHLFPFLRRADIELPGISRITVSAYETALLQGVDGLV
jgi:hypothetical protein